MFNALVLEKSDGTTDVSVRKLEVDDLPSVSSNEVLLDVLYSSLNYKDALAVSDADKVIRGDYPIVPGIDLVGRVLESDSDPFTKDDLVIGTGWQLGEVDWGGYTQRAKVEGRKIVRLPEGLTPLQAMTIGTAGFTAMLSVMALEEHNIKPQRGEVVVTGASGGVGSVAVTLLDALDYDVVASTGSEEAHDYLMERGATRVIDRRTFEDGPERPMDTGRWAGAVDAVGGTTLATLISQMKRHGSIASFGNTGGHMIETSILPFILRGINLLGVDSNTCPNDRRRDAWERLAIVLTDDDLEKMRARIIGLEDIPSASRDVMAGAVQGRIVVDVHA